MASLISFGFMIAMIPWRAFVLPKLWYWFLVPVWPILAVPKWNLYGASLIVTFLTLSATREKETTTKDAMIYGAVASFLNPLIMLTIGWAIKQICL